MILIIIALLVADEIILRLTDKCEEELDKIEEYFSIVILADECLRLNATRRTK